ncbi:transposase [Candidatus Midichloria mitochondrii]|uniref:transposase n=1 Tax=Candidatus Midichloria mitochondrii TaxID=234827 RepID=UPI001F2A5BE7|nr:transposase [Candidatus Midichloria mitochondrii]
MIETAIRQLKEICQIQHTQDTAHQIISWQTSSQGSWAYVFKPNISHGKIGSRALLLTSN